MTSRRLDLLLHIPYIYVVGRWSKPVLYCDALSQNVTLGTRFLHADGCLYVWQFHITFFFFTKHLFLFSHSRLNKDCWVLVALSLSERGQRITALLCRLQGFCLPSSTSSVTGCLLLQETRPSLLKGTQNQVTRDGGQLGLCKKCPQVILGVLWSDGHVLTAEDIRRWQDSCKIMEWRLQVSQEPVFPPCGLLEASLAQTAQGLGEGLLLAEAGNP